MSRARALTAMAVVSAVIGCGGKGASSASGGAGGSAGAGAGAGASGGTGGTGGAGAADGAATCPKRWTVQAVGTGATASATVADGALVLRSANSQPGSLLAVLQTGLTGDFDAAFDYEAFMPGGAGAFVQAAASEAVAAPTTPIVTAGIGRIPTAQGTIPGLSALFQPAPPSSVQPTSAVAGTFRFQRAGSSMTVTASPGGGGPSATATAPSYGTFAMQIGVQIGSNVPGVIASETSVRILTFTLTGGGSTVTSDDFACDSLK